MTDAQLSRKEYEAVHYWIRKNYGKATHCEKDPSHKSTQYEWANISGEYKRDISDYIQLCPSCHRKMDNDYSRCKHGHLFTAESTYVNPRGLRECKICRRKALANFRARQINCGRALKGGE